MPLKVKNKNVAELIDKFLEIESDFQIIEKTPAFKKATILGDTLGVS